MSAVFLFFAAFTVSAKDQKIEATAGPGGSIDPSGEVKVPKFYSITFTITADDGYEIEDVLVDDESVRQVDCLARVGRILIFVLVILIVQIAQI